MLWDLTKAHVPHGEKSTVAKTTPPGSGACGMEARLTANLETVETTVPDS